jgi:hypothetical protein
MSGLFTPGAPALSMALIWSQLAGGMAEMAHCVRHTRQPGQPAQLEPDAVHLGPRLDLRHGLIRRQGMFGPGAEPEGR